MIWINKLRRLDYISSEHLNALVLKTWVSQFWQPMQISSLYFASFLIKLTKLFSVIRFALYIIVSLYYLLFYMSILYGFNTLRGLQKLMHKVHDALSCSVWYSQLVSVWWVSGNHLHTSEMLLATWRTRQTYIAKAKLKYEITLSSRTLAIMKIIIKLIRHTVLCTILRSNLDNNNFA